MITVEVGGGGKLVVGSGGLRILYGGGFGGCCDNSLFC